MNILAIDTSSKNCSVAILKDEEILSEYNINYEKQHSVILMPLLEDMLNKLSMQVKDMDYFAINVGPGSFTGLRIGLSVIKAMAFATNKEILTFDSFKVLAEPLRYSNKEILVVSDALRNTFYSQLLSFNDGDWTILEKASVRDINEIEGLLKKTKEEGRKVLVTGDGAKKLIKILTDLNIESTDESFSSSKASSLLTLSKRYIDKNKDNILNKEQILENNNNVKPVYMRKSQAEREYDLKMGIKDEE